MTYTNWLGLAPLMLMLAVAALVDARHRRLPNWLTITLMLSGLMQSFTYLHMARPSMAVLGIVAGFGLMLGQFVLGGVGGGDVKLMMGVGAWLGPIPLVAIFAGTSVVGLIIVVVQAVWQRRLKVLLHNCATVLVNLVNLRHVGMDHAIATGKLCRSVDRPLPYAVPVLLATLLVAGLQGLL